ncbi:MAG: hypothetical protein AAF468_19165 [Pseudomonadota bacterium]
MFRILFSLVFFVSAHQAFAKSPTVAGVPPFTEAILPVGQDLFAVAIGPGGPGVEFGSDAVNGGLYRISADGAHEVIELSDGQGLRNPTGLVEVEGQIVMVDGNQVISTSPEGVVKWRKSLNEDGVFFYDVEVLDDTSLIVSDFGRGVFVQVSSETGNFQAFLQNIKIKGLARFKIDGDQIHAASWGADDAWDSAVYRVSNISGGAVSEKLTDGFGNLESVEIINGELVVGAYRGHKDHQMSKLMKVGADGSIQPLQAGSETRGVSDIFFDGKSVWLTFFYDAAFSRQPVERFLAE